MNNSIRTDYNIEDTGALMTRAKGGGRTKRIIIIAAALIAVLAIALVGWKLLGDKRYNDQVEIAEKEFVEGNYEQAEADYLEAVEMKKREPKAREGLAYTYAVLEKWDDSKKTYLELYDDTDDKKYEEAAKEVEEEKLPSNPDLIPGRKTPKKENANADNPNAAKTKEVYAAYAEVLKVNEAGIKKYWWQNNSDNKPMHEYLQYEYGEVVDDIKSQNVVLYDIDGDGSPELLFVSQDDDYKAYLHLYTFKEGQAVECICNNVGEFGETIYSQEENRIVMDWAAAAGNKFLIYTGKEAGSFYIACRTGDAHDSYTSTKYSLEADGSIKKLHVTNNRYENTTIESDEYTIDGKSVSMDEGTASFKQHREDYETLLMFSGYSKDLKIFEKVKEDSPVAMTYDEAMKQLQGE